MRSFAAVAALLAAVVVGKDTPAEKVIQLLEELKSEVEEEGKTEAKTYDTFSCFCKDTTTEKEDAIKEEQDNIDDFTATIEEQTEISNAKAEEIAELNFQIDTLTKDIEKLEAMREKEHQSFEVNDADLGKGVFALEGAISDIKGGKSLLEVGKSLRQTLVFADMLGMDVKHKSKFVSFLQDSDAGDDVPESDYEFHEGSNQLIETLQGLDEDFHTKKSDVEETEAQAKKDHLESLRAKNNEKTSAEEAKEATQAEKDDADEVLNQALEDKALEDAKLADDSAYLKDLTSQCELKAREFDQHSKMRTDEITALTKALEIITDRVKGKADDVNERALLQQAARPAAAAKQQAPVAPAEEEDDSDTISFIQDTSSPRHRLSVLAQRRGKVSAAALSRRQRVEKAVKALGAAGGRLGSPTLSALALKLNTKIAADPFVKVKKLIQDLIQRLVKEATEEATKKGWCDTEMGKSEHTRDLNMDKVTEYNNNVELLEAQKATLEEEISTLTAELADLTDSLAKTTKIRADEKAENLDTVKKATEGLAAVKEAYQVLSDFYNKAKKAEVSLAQVRASPVDEDAPEAPKGGAYKGGQQKAGGILAMLDVVISDFERTVKVTTAAEKDALREFVEYERATKTSIVFKETSKADAETTLKGTDAQIAEDMDLLEKHMKMLDDSLKELEDLKPACVDSGMSYEERVQKRKDEIGALKEALCMLDGEGVEDECK